MLCYLVRTRELFCETFTGLLTPFGAHGHHQAFSSRLKDACRSMEDFAQLNLMWPSETDFASLCWLGLRRKAER